MTERTRTVVSVSKDQEGRPLRGGVGEHAGSYRLSESPVRYRAPLDVRRKRHAGRVSHVDGPSSPEVIL